MYIKKTYSRIGELNTILLQNFDDEIFSAGTHFKDLFKLAQKNDIRGFEQHLNSLQKLSFYTSCYDKPMIVNLKGTLCNSATAVFSNFHFTITPDKNLKFKFDSIDYNSTPLGGELFLLKNLPNKIGLYLALVGGELNLSDLLRFKLIYGVAEIDENVMLQLKNHTHWEPILKSYELNNDYTNDTRLNKKRDIEWTIEEFLDRSQKENPQKVLLDLYYRKNVIEHANIRQRMKQHQSYQINNKHDRRVVQTENNHLEYENFLNKHLEFQKLELDTSETVENRVKIFRIFQKEKIEDILEALEEDGSDFAIRTFSILKKRNKNLMQVVVDMFKAADQKTFVECLEIEFATMKKLFQNNQFRKEAFKKNKNLNLETKIDIAQTDDNFNFKKHRKDLLPTRNYYKEFPEAFLSYLNQTDLQNPYQCKNYVEVVKGNLFRIGVDYLNPTYDREEVKEKLGMFFTSQNNLHQKFQEFHDFISDRKMFDDHLRERKQAIQKLTDQENFQDLLNKMIDKIFSDNNKKEQELVHKRAKEMARLELSKNMNSIKNFFVKTFFTKPNKNDFVSDTIFGNHTLLDIGSDRYELSKRFKQKINFNEIKKKYSASHKISPKELENYLKNRDIQVESELNVNKNKLIQIDWSKQYVKRDTYLTRKRKWKINLKLADYIHERGLPTAEQNFRNQMVSFLKETFERTCRVLNDDEQKEFEKTVLDTFFIDYNQYKDFRDFMHHALENLLEFHKPIIGTEEVKLQEFNNDIQQNKERKLVEFNKEKIDNLKNLIFMENNEPIENNNFLITCNTLKEFLLESEFLAEEEKNQFKILFKGNNKLIEQFQSDCQKEFDQKMNELESKNLQFLDDFNNQINYIQVNYDLEVRNYVLPNIFYRNAKKFLKNIQNLYEKIQNKCQFKDHKQIIDIIQKENLFSMNKDNIQENLHELDQQIKLCISIVNQTKDMLTDQQLILDRQYDVVQQALKNLVGESKNIQKMVDFVKNKILEDDDGEVSTEICSDELDTILLTKDQLKEFLDKYQLSRRKNWNPIFKELVNFYSEIVEEKSNLYSKQDNSFKEIKAKYQNNVDNVAAKLIAENVIVDYNPFSNLLLVHDKLLNRMKFQELNQQQSYETFAQFFYLEKQNIDQSDTRFFNTTPPTIFQIEKLSKRLAHRGSSAMDVYLNNNQGQYIKIIEESGEKWAMDQLQNILQDIFAIRRKIEKRFNHDQLINLDYQLSAILNKEYISQLLQESFESYKFELEGIQKKVMEFNQKNEANKKESIDKISRAKHLDPIKDLDFLKLSLSFVLSIFNSNDIQDFDDIEIENDFGNLIHNPKKFMRMRKKWSIKPAALVENHDNDTNMNQRHYIKNDYSEIYSHASQIMFDKYNQARFKNDHESCENILNKLNKKAEIVLHN